MSELEVPQAAVDRLWICHEAADEDGHEPCDECVRQIVEPVVVHELRRLLDDHEPWELLEAIHRRIAELES